MYRCNPIVGQAGVLSPLFVDPLVAPHRTDRLEGLLGSGNEPYTVRSRVSQRCRSTRVEPRIARLRGDGAHIRAVPVD